MNKGPICSTLLPQNFGEASLEYLSSPSPIKDQLLPIKQKQSNSLSFPLNCLVQGWAGSNLPNHSSRLLSQVIQLLTEEAKQQFYSFHFKNRSFKQTIYDEFLDYAHSNNLHFPESDIDFFWQQVQDSSHSVNTPEEQVELGIHDFIEIYCYRATIIYLLKLRLVLKLVRGEKLHQDSLPLSREHLLYPNSFLVKTFQIGSREEFYCESLRSNPYSWYRPNENSLPLIEFLADTLTDISSTELIKISSHPKERHLSDEQDESNSKFSHALSQLSFGEYLKKLLIHLPRWINQEEMTPAISTACYPGSLTCRIVGQHLVSIAHSHWLSQEGATDKNWSQLLSPNFCGSSFLDGHFVRIFNELSYLSFLVNFSITRMLRPQRLICDVFRQGDSSDADITSTLKGQIPLPSLYKPKELRQYDRVVISHPTTSRRNPHHFLVQKIQQEMQFLKPNGFLTVLSGQNLFVPSQKDRTIPLLEKLKLESYFNLEELKGRGELSPYIYIFSLKTDYPHQSNAWKLPTGITALHLKESCLSFKFKGELTTFGRLAEFTHELTSFMRSRDASSTPLFKKNLEGGLQFEFHQDAIIDGQLVQSASSSDPTKITHPRFFDNLTKSCLPLDNFLQFEKLSHKQDDLGCDNLKHHHPFDFLANSNQRYKSYNAILIINYQQRNNVKLEIIPAETYPAKLELLGTAYYQYFGVIAKSPEVNLNIFREYFESDIGCQVIQLTLHGPSTKLKPKLNALLVPKFFTTIKPIPSTLSEGFAPLVVPTDDLIKQLPHPLLDDFKQIEQMLPQLAKRYPHTVLSILSQFKINTEILIGRMESSSGNQQVDYANSVVMEQILSLTTYSLFPNNDQFYVNFMVSDPADVRLPLVSLKIERSDDLHSLVLTGGAQDRHICSIIGKEAGILFLNSLLSNLIGTSISTLLRTVQIPDVEELAALTNLLDDQVDALRQLNSKSHDQINQIISQQITL